MVGGTPGGAADDDLGVYRTPGLVVRSPALSVPPMRRPAKPRVVGAAVLTAIAGAAVVSTSLGVAAIAGGAVSAVACLYFERRQRGQLRALAALPFPVRHNLRGFGTTWEQHRRPIRQVTLRLVAGPGRVELDRFAAALDARAPGLSIATRDDTFAISAWPWGVDDIALLVELLRTWAQALHAEYPIAEVEVAWIPLPLE